MIEFSEHVVLSAVEPRLIPINQAQDDLAAGNAAKVATVQAHAHEAQVSETQSSEAQGSEEGYPAAQVQHWVSEAVQPFVKVWPLQTFIACNPLIHYEGVPFFEAIQQAQADLGWDGPFQPESLKHLYQAAVQAGHVSVVQLSQQLDAYLQRQNLESVKLGSSELPIKALLWADLEASMMPNLSTGASDGDITAFMPSLLACLKRDGVLALSLRQVNSRETPLSERVGRQSNQPVSVRIDEQLVKWCASFLDQGQGMWPMPKRELGLRGAWQLLAGYDHQLSADTAQRLRQCLASLPSDSDAAIGVLLAAMGITESDALGYLRAHLARLPGWVGHLRWVAEQANDVSILSDYLVMCLSYEWALCGIITQVQWGCEPNLQLLEIHWQADRSGSGHSPQLPLPDEALNPEVQGWSRRLANLMGRLNLSASTMNAMLQTSGGALLSALSAFDWPQKGRILLEAMEAEYQTALLHQLTPQVSRLSSAGQALAPAEAFQAQAVFCIDVRSESFRRQLEAQDGIQTFGLAGFFGASIQLTALGDCHSKDLCPALLKPAYALMEVPLPDVAERAHWHLGNKLSRKYFKASLLGVKQEPAATFGYVETLGLAHSVPMILGTLFPRLSARLKNYFKQLVEPDISVRPHLSPDGAGSTASSTVPAGMPLAAQVQVAEGLLNSIGLREGFAPFVLLCGHGAQVVNNPYASDCGACGGNQGGSNALVLAEILNNPRVRARLAERGIVISAQTRFLAAEHNTVTDEVRILNAYCLADASSEDESAFQRLVQSLKGAAVLNRQSRSQSLPAILESSSASGEHLHAHAVDWSQIRPEWGLAGNAAFIIGPRDLTAEVDLEGRAFLHSYSWEADPEGKVLEGLLTAPLVVGEWINMQYWFSTMDNHRFGSGSKLQHNVVGQLGVMLGNASDLQMGLPQQSVMRDAQTPYHMPLRLTAVVVAPTSTVAKLIQRQPVLQTLFQNEWVKLLVLDPVTRQFQRYGSDGCWEVAS